MNKYITMLLVLLLPLCQVVAITVYDPANHAQNILSAVRAAISNVNEAKMLAHQVQSLANDLKNLTKLDYSMVDEFSGDLHQLFGVLGQIDGLMSELDEVDARYSDLYPDYQEWHKGISGEDYQEQTRAWIDENRDMMRGALKTGAQILSSLPSSQEQIDKLVVDSQDAIGILQAAQASNQLTAEVGGQLIKLNSMLATWVQADASSRAQSNAERAALENRMRHVLEPMETPEEQPLPVNIFTP